MILLRNRLRQLSGSKLLLVFIFILIKVNFAQDKSDFEKGVQNFNLKNYNEAIFYLEKFTQKKSQHSETASFLLILSYYYLNELDKSKNLIHQFKLDYPNSKYLEKVLETQLAISVNQKDLEGLKSSLISLNNSVVETYKLEQFVNVFRKIFAFTNDAQNFEIGALITNHIIKFAFLKVLFETAIDRKNSTLIKNTYRDLIQLGLHYGLLKINKIGVLIPIGTKSGAVENLIIEGLKFAVHHYNQIHQENKELLIYKGDQKYLEEALINLTKNPEVLCVVGPLYSEQFKALSNLADKLCIPLISPTATAADISLKSKYVFQFNPTLDVRGYAMFSFAYDKLKLNRFALINPESQNLNVIRKVIRERIKNSKSELIAEVSWKETKKELPSKIRELRRIANNKDLVIRFNSLMDFETEQKLISYGMSQKKIDSLKSVEAEVSIYEIFGRDAEKICQNNRINYYKRAKSIVNDLSIPIYLFDAIFIPISNADLIAEIVNEIEKQNIITKIIGNDIWNSLDELNKAYPASNGVLFTSDFYFDNEDETFKTLSTEIYEWTAIQPNRTFFYGFETGNKILNNFNNNLDRENFYESLVRDSDYEGYSSDIILNKDGINSSVYILEYKNRKIRKIDRIIAE